MTLDEARRFIQEAENLPTDQVDPEKLAEAIRVIDEGTRIDLSGLARQLERVGRVFDTQNDDALLGPLGRALKEALGSGGSIDKVITSLAQGLDNVLVQIEENERQRLEELAERQARGEDLSEAEKEVLLRDLEERSRALATRVMGPTASEDRIGPGRTERTPPGRAEAERGSASPTIRRTIHSRTPGIPAALANRLFNAGAAVGLSPSEVQAVIAQARTDAAQAQTIPGAPPVSVEEILEAQVIDWMTTAQPIGVRPDFVATREEEIPVGEGLERFRRERGIIPGTRTQEVVPRYFEGDEWNLAGLSPEEVANWQRRLVDAGLMEPDTFYPGVWTQIEADALKSAMGISNARGTDLDATLADLAANLPEDVKERRRLEETAKIFQAPPFVSPDMASLAQGAKGYARQRIGREPRPEEMAELTNFMSQLYRQDYEAEVAAMRADFEANRVLEETGVAQTPASVPDVDPEAQFREFFDRRFGAEIEFIEEQEETTRHRDNVFASLRTMGNLIG